MSLALIGCSWCLAMGSCSNSSVLQKEDLEHLRCKLSRLKRAETGSDWMLWVLCDNGFVFKQLCSAPSEGHRCKLSSWCYVTMGSCSNSSVLLCDIGLVFKQLCSAPEG